MIQPYLRSVDEKSDAERAVGDAIVEAALKLLSPLLYARVDLVESEDECPGLLELELTEPSLFLHHDP